MRDTRKPVSYFESYLQYEKSRIEHRIEKLSACDDTEKRTRISENLFLDRMNMLIASFSYGATQSELSELFHSTCSTAEAVRSLTYDNALTLASFAVMLEDGDSIRPLFKRFHTVFAGDKLLSGMQTYIETGIATWNGDYRFPSPYAGLDAVISASGNVAKEKALLTYLDGWYAQCNDLAWYNTVNSSSDVYFGYWSFESAAVAKIFDLNGRVLSQNPYFPVI